MSDIELGHQQRSVDTPGVLQSSIDAAANVVIAAHALTSLSSEENP